MLPSTVAKAANPELLARADEVARAAGGTITEVTPAYGGARRRVLVASTDGVLTDDDEVRTRLNVLWVASGDAGRRTGYESVAHTTR